MRLVIQEQKASEVFFENTFYKTKVELDVPFDTAVRLSKITNVDFLIDKKADYNPDLFSKEKKFGFTSDIDQVSGWGNVSFNLLKYSKDYKIGLTGKIFNVSDRDIYNMRRTPIEESGAMVWHEQPKNTWEQSPFSRNIAIIPFETTVIPASWIPKINKFDALFVPCEQNKEAFSNSGVTVPIEIVHWGIDTDQFAPITRKEGRPFTFGHMGALSVRKGTDVLIDAFREEFPPHLYPNVRLINKTSNLHYQFMVKDSRIVVQMMPVTHEELVYNFWSEIDCFVFPTRGEGWGLPPMEAMATGVPVIGTNWSGLREFLSPEDSFLLDYKLVPAKDFTEKVYKEFCGDWAEPSKEHLKQLMRYAYEHPEEVKEMGKKASERIRRDFSWQAKIPMFHEALKKHL